MSEFREELESLKQESAKIGSELKKILDAPRLLFSTTFDSETSLTGVVKTALGLGYVVVPSFEVDSNAVVLHVWAKSVVAPEAKP